ncbi:nitrate/nitrite transporter [Lutibacter sp.]|uniref:MFS transporter n=1 Tax=Lutibacter sp. TaxID=1925666 RepID=UPI001A1EA6D8|nr:MFS transporter [Lutibacter sp.]MBI9042413.1 MFS transporter [Lutibacter sp.]
MSNQNKFSVINPSKVPFFYGYIVLIFGTIGVWFSMPGQTVGVSVFTDPVKDALGLSRNQFSNAYMIGTFLSSLVLGNAGKWFDKYGARYVAFFAAILLGFSLLLCSVSVQISAFIQETLAIRSWIIPFSVITVLFFFIRFSGQGVLTMASRNMIMMWFHKNRGKVNSITSIAVSLGFSSSPLFLNVLINDNGWEVTWQILAFSLLIFSVFIVQFYRNKPENFNLLPDGISNLNEDNDLHVEIEKQFTLKEAKGIRAFWMYGLILSFNSFFITGFTFHIVSIFGVHNYTQNQAIAIFIPISIISIIVSTIFNILSDYLKHQLYLFIMILSGIIAAFGLLFLSLPFGVYFLIIGLGFMGGMFAVLNAVTWPRFFGRNNLGAITGKIMSMLVLASAIAPSIFSFSFSNLGSYKYVGYISIAFLMFLLVGSVKAKNPQ